MKTVILYGLSNPKNVKNSYVCGTPFSYLPVTNSDHHHIEPHNGNASHDNGHPSIGVFFLCLFAFNDDGDNCHSHSHHRSTSTAAVIWCNARCQPRQPPHKGLFIYIHLLALKTATTTTCTPGGKKHGLSRYFIFIFPTRLRLIEGSIQYIIFQYDT